jgi:hypothetical protein
MTTVDSFEYQLVVDSLPPSIEQIDAALAQQFPGHKILHWAIVRCDKTLRRLWLEGSFVQ